MADNIHHGSENRPENQQPQKPKSENRTENRPEKRTENQKSQKQKSENRQARSAPIRNTTQVLGPYTYIAPSYRTITAFLLCALVPQIAMLVLTKTYNSLFVILCALAASLAAEICASNMQKIPVFSRTGGASPILQGLLAGMFLPGTYDLPSVFLIAFFTLLLVKLAFGNSPYSLLSWVNAAALVVVVAYFFGADTFPEFQVAKSFMRGEYPSLTFVQSGNIHILDNDEGITNFLNRTVFQKIGVSVPSGYISLLWDSGSPIPAFRFNLLTLAASIFLFAFRIVNRTIPFFFLLVYIVLIKVFGSSFYANPRVLSGDIAFALFTGGTLFVALFMLDAFSLSPKALLGKAIYGMTAGVLFFFIAGIGTSPAGGAVTLCVANIASLIIRQLDSALYAKSLAKREALRRDSEKRGDEQNRGEAKK
ncbi:MAG: RnfABCDGE type electron transport complex subunit D [Treponemataceae bacterium]|nr:MAG: RnfABCDGE type electron transport complex subunit D [Treponemataceae bacterium]